MKKTLAITGVVGILLLLFSGFSLTTTASSDSKWLNGEPTLSDLDKVVSDLPSSQVQGGNLDCNEREIVTKQKFEIFGNSLPFLNKESHDSCATKTNYGAWSSSGYLVRNGSVIGGNVFNSITGAKMSGFIYVPNSDHLLQTTGDNTRFYKNFSNYLKSDYADSKVKHTFDMGKAPTEYLTDSVGNRLNIFSYPLSFSSNGKFLIAESRTSSAIIRYNLETNDYLAFAPGFNRNIGVDPAAQYAISSDGRYAIVSSGPQPRFILYDLNTCVAKTNQAYKECSSVNLLPLYKSKVADFIAPSHIRFVDNYSLKLHLISKNAQGQYTFRESRLTATGHTIPSYGYLALGDSFASGEGAYEYKPGTDEKEPLNKCHVSLRSYPFLLGKDLNLNQYESVACSGAILEDVGSDTINPYRYYKDVQSEGINAGDEAERGKILDNFLSGYIPQRGFLDKYKPNIVTVSVSGNDIGFGDIIKRCALLPDNCYESYEDRYNLVLAINSQYQRLVDTYTSVRDLSAHDAKIYAIGYPQVIKPEGDCAANVRASNDEAYFINDLAKHLNLMVEKAAKRAGVSYIDVSNAFYGQRLCEGPSYNSAVNGFTLGDDTFLDIGPVGKESYHPNRTGHALFAEMIKEQTNDFKRQNPGADENIVGPTIEDANYLLKDRPYRGGRIVLSQGDVGFKYSFESRDALIKITGFGPHARVQLEVRSEPTSLGEFITDENGNLEVSTDIPSSVEPGFHTIYAYSKDSVGQDIMTNKFVYIPHSAQDYDGDGTPNDQDSCLIIAPSGHDDDRDGKDDACDELIGLPPDTEPPSVAGSTDKTANSEGWYNSDVLISWTSTDPDPSSGNPTIPAPTLASQDGDHTYTSEQSCDPSGNCSSGSLPLKIDKTKPEINFSLYPAPNINGWNNSEVTISFTCSDSTSGVASCSQPQKIEAVDGGYLITGVTTDRAGNTSEINAVVMIDMSKPNITEAVSPAPNGSGWHNQDVTIQPECSDELSGVAHCTSVITLSTEGLNQTVSYEAIDKAGNSSSSASIISLDKTIPQLGEPVVSGCLPILSPCVVINGFFSQNATISAPATDQLSQVSGGEYFVGADPGLGNGNVMFYDGSNIYAPVPKGLPSGKHTIFVRTRDTAGNWSIVKSVTLRFVEIPNKFN